MMNRELEYQESVSIARGLLIAAGIGSLLWGGFALALTLILSA